MHSALETYRTWLWKEWRDHRAVTIGILIALPGLTGLAYWAFGEQLADSHLHSVRTWFLGTALVLVNFAIAASLFAGEVRRGTIECVRRLPGGFRAAFLAKVTFLCLLVLAVTVWQTLALALAEASNKVELTHVLRPPDDGATRAGHLLEQLAAFPLSPLWIHALGFGVLTLWTLLVSTWMGRSGVASVGALLVLAVLGVPFALLFLDHRYFFPGWLDVIQGATGIAAVVAAIALTVSYIGGQRFAGRPLRPFLLGSAVLLIALCGGYAYGQLALDDWLELDPHAEDFRIHEAHVAAGERYLYVTVHRGRLWQNGRSYGVNPVSPKGRIARGTPPQAWIVDVETDAIRRVHTSGSSFFMRIPESSPAWFGPLEPQHAVVSYQTSDAQQSIDGYTWWDAAQAQPHRLLAAGVRDSTSLALVRKTLAANSWLRDTEGRRVWLRDGLYEREGDVREPAIGITARPKRTRSLQPAPGGWFSQGSPARTDHAASFLHASTGMEEELRPGRHVGFFARKLISDRHFVGYSRSKDDNGRRVSRPVLLPLLGGEPLEPRNPPENLSWGSTIGKELVLARREGRFHAWNPVTGETRAIEWQGERLQGIRDEFVFGRAGDGRMLVMLFAMDPPSSAFALLSPDARTLQRLTGWGNWTRLAPVALLKDGSVVLREDERRIVKYAPGGAREVLFPR